MAEQLALLPGYLTAHLQLTLAAMLAGLLISVPTGVWVSRDARRESAVLGVASVLQTIPSLALLALMVPLLALLGSVSVEWAGVEIRSIGFLPAVLALTLYSILPMLRNTVTGIAGVDPAIVEAARGVGMTPRQRLLRVELPLALPVIVAGVRTAIVWVVGTATLATPVGATSLGNFIFSGLQTRNLTAVFVGSLAAAILAISLDALVRLLEVGLIGRSRLSIGFASAALLSLFGFAGGALVVDLTSTAPRPVVVGAKTFTEQYILSEVIAQQVARATGLPTRAVQSLGSTVVFDALRTGEIDVYVDYSGTIWATIMKRDGLPENRADLVPSVTRFLADEYDVLLIGSLGFENTYAFGMRDTHARSLGIASLTDLVRHAPGLEVGGDYEFFSRPEWTAVEAAYGLRFAEIRSMDSALMYQAVAGGDVDVISAFSTDGRIAAFELTLLADDLGVIPPYDAIVLASARLVRERPDVIAALRALSGTIDASAMQRMNYAVDEGGESPASVATGFLDALSAR